MTKYNKYLLKGVYKHLYSVYKDTHIYCIENAVKYANYNGISFLLTKLKIIYIVYKYYYVQKGEG